MKNILKKLKDIVTKHLDKLLHMLTCFFIQVFGASILVATCPLGLSMGIAFALAVILSLAKELYDKLDYGLWSWHDLVADGIGILLGIIAVILIATK